MDSSAADAPRAESDWEQPGWVSAVVVAVFVACVAASLTVIPWEGQVVGAVGFCVIVPGLVGGVLGALVRRSV